MRSRNVLIKIFNLIGRYAANMKLKIEPLWELFKDLFVAYRIGIKTQVFIFIALLLERFTHGLEGFQVILIRIQRSTVENNTRFGSVISSLNAKIKSYHAKNHAFESFKKQFLYINIQLVNAVMARCSSKERFR